MLVRTVLLTSMFVLSVAASIAQSPFEIEGVRTGLKRSPDDYVACVFEYIGRVQCEAGPNGDMCWVMVSVVDEIASRPNSASPRRLLKIAAGGEPGTRITGRGIAFLVPIEGTNIYSGTFLTNYGTKKHERFRRLIEAAISGTESL